MRSSLRRPPSSSSISLARLWADLKFQDDAAAAAEVVVVVVVRSKTMTLCLMPVRCLKITAGLSEDVSQMVQV